MCTLITSEANANRFFSPPEIPRSLPGIPMTVSAHFFSPSYERMNFPEIMSLKNSHNYEP